MDNRLRSTSAHLRASKSFGRDWVCKGNEQPQVWHRCRREQSSHLENGKSIRRRRRSARNENSWFRVDPSVSEGELQRGSQVCQFVIDRFDCSTCAASLVVVAQTQFVGDCLWADQKCRFFHACAIRIATEGFATAREKLGHSRTVHCSRPRSAA